MSVPLNGTMGISLLCSFIFLSLQKVVLSEELCGETKKVSAVEGRKVQLPIDDIEIRIIFWIREPQLTYIARTEPGKINLTLNNPYKGRLNVTVSGSLIITKVIQEDQGMYRADIVRSKESQCVQLYDLKVLGLDPVDYRALRLVRLLLSACVFLLTCCVSVHHLRSEIFHRGSRNDDGV